MFNLQLKPRSHVQDSKIKIYTLPEKTEVASWKRIQRKSRAFYRLFQLKIICPTGCHHDTGKFRQYQGMSHWWGWGAAQATVLSANSRQIHTRAFKGDGRRRLPLRKSCRVTGRSSGHLARHIHKRENSPHFLPKLHLVGFPRAHRQLILFNCLTWLFTTSP